MKIVQNISTENWQDYCSGAEARQSLRPATREGRSRRERVGGVAGGGGVGGGGGHGHSGDNVERGRKRREGAYSDVFREETENREGDERDGCLTEKGDRLVALGKEEVNRDMGEEVECKRNVERRERLSKHSSKTNINESSSRYSRSSKTQDKPGLSKISSEKNLKLPVGQSKRPPRRSMVVTKEESKEVESLRRERRKAREERDKLQSKEGSNGVEQETGEQKQRVEKGHRKRNSPKEKQRPDTLNLHTSNRPSISQPTMKLEGGPQNQTRKLEAKRSPPPQPPSPPPPPPPNPYPPIGQSLSTLHLNLAELAHIRTQVGHNFFL